MFEKTKINEKKIGVGPFLNNIKTSIIFIITERIRPFYFSENKIDNVAVFYCSVDYRSIKESTMTKTAIEYVLQKMFTSQSLFCQFKQFQ